MANNNITLKINSAKETLETIHLKSGTVTAIAAQNKVNYQFIDEKTGFAPENIMIKRDGKDLKIAFEGSDIENPDLIIINYYDEDVGAYKDSLLVGTHENGSTYPYVPESTLQPDAVTELADQVSAGQALGGNPLGAFWAFSPLWLLALLPLALAGVALTKGGVFGGSDSNSNPGDTTPPARPDVEAQSDGSVKITPPSDPDTKKVEITYTDENGNDHTSTVEKGDDGKWKTTDPNLVVDPDTGVVTIPADKVKDGSEVTGKATDESGNTGEEGKTNAGNNPDTTPPGQPSVDGKVDGSVVVTPPSDPDTKKVEITYTDEDGNDHTSTVEKGDDGKWKTTDPNLVVDPDTGVVTIPADKVKDGSEVTGKATDESGNTGEEGKGIAGNNPGTTTDDNTPTNKDLTPPGKPDVEAQNDGSVKVAPPKDADTQKVDIDYPGEDGKDHTVTVEKDKDGNWKITNPDENPGVTVDPETGIVTIPEDKVKDGGEVTATATDKSGNEGDSDSATAKAPPVKAPIVEILDGGDGILNAKEVEDGVKAKITLPKEAKEGNILKVDTDGDGEPDIEHTLTAEDIANGNVVIDVPAEDVPPTGGTLTVSATITNNDGAVSPKGMDLSKVDTAKPTPDVDANQDGSVTIDPVDEDATDIKVTYPGEDGKDHTVEVEKGEDGTWKITNPDENPGVTVDPDTGIVTIPPEVVKDGGEVTATVTDKGGNTGTDSDTAKEPIDLTDKEPPRGQPGVEILDGGDGVLNGKEIEDGVQVKVTLPKDAKEGDKVEVDTDGDGQPDVTKTLTPEDIANGSIIVDVPADDIPETGGTLKVTAKVVNPDGVDSPKGSDTTTVDTTPPGKPDVVAQPDGSITVAPPADEDTKEVEVTYPGEDGEDHTVTVEKDDDGTWKITNPDENPGVTVDPETGVITIPEDKVKDGGEVTGKATDEAGNTGEDDTTTAEEKPNIPKDPIDTVAPGAPDVDAKDDGSVVVTPPTDKDTKEVEITYTDEDGEDHTVTVEKGEDGTWEITNPDENPGVTVDPETGVVTIPADKVKDGSEVVGRATDETGNTGPEDRDTAGNNPDTTAPGAPDVEA
ncbi:hypothetical protein, partial [Avibacterium avium]|uniref:hypothetical protein n=1 Tax=Avibacterium avium TaxID=751 RepID=UPI003BF8FE42